MVVWNIKSVCNRQIFAVTFCAKISTKATIKKLLGESGIKIKMLVNGFIYNCKAQLVLTN